ncbi:chorismate mutase [Sphingorhabdus sp.]|uniref:chorismate mutase n=1 Tax=Sphingorhabdus sp. TaxID=1902408 RepID=UPI00391AB14A
MSSTASPIQPATCTTMTEVRAGVDAVDAQLIELLAVRFGYMDAAARIKTERAAVRDEARKQQVLANVQAAADKAGVPVEVVADLWERLVEASIAYEFDKWDASRA